MSLGHLFNEMCDAAKRLASDKVKENYEASLKVATLHYAAIVKLKYLDGIP